MCCKLLLYLVNFKKISFSQQRIYIICVFIFIVVGINFIEYIYQLEGLPKLFIYFVLILFLIGSIFNTIKIVVDTPGDFKSNYICIYYCIQLIGISVTLMFFIFKFFTYS